MLAQNFKSPADLKISDAEYRSLITVLGMLERGEIKDAPGHASFGGVYSAGQSPPPSMFRMASVSGVADCGTACCIMGWAKEVGGQNLFPDIPRKGRFIYDLFYPLNSGIVCRSAEKGAAALRNFLTDGSPRWEEVLAS